MVLIWLNLVNPFQSIFFLFLGMREDLPLSHLAITSCSHIFCKGCIKDQLETFSNQKCALCNTPMTEKDVFPLAGEISAWGVKVNKCVY